MATLIENANALKAVFMDIKNAIKGKGVSIPNGTPVTEYADLIINIQTGAMPEMQDKTITENGVYTSDYPYYGLGKVTVDTTDAWLSKAEMLMGMFAYKPHIVFSAFDVYNAWNIDYMFRGCNDLTQMTLDGKAISRGEYAFANCPNLANVTFNCEINKTSIPSTTSGYSASIQYMFGYSSKDVDVLNIHVSGEITNAAHMFCKCYAKNIVLTSDYNGAKGCDFESGFSGCNYAKTIEINGIKISDLQNGFNGCSLLETINLDTSSCTRAYRTFYNCSALKNITLSSAKSFVGDGDKSLKASTFQGCTALENLIINEENTTVTSIDIHYSNNITVESMLSIFNSLKPRDTAQTSSTSYQGVVILGSTNLAKLTEEQKNIAYNKNWLLA